MPQSRAGSTTSFAFAPALEQAAALRAGELTALELADLYLERIDRYNPQLAAYVWVDPDETRREAREADAKLRSGAEVGPLHGLPFPVKDLHDAAGQPTFMGSLGTDPGVRDTDDLAIAALRSAGCVLMGRSHAPEAGTMSVTETRRFGIARNPWNPDRSPGGSSGGAAAAVAAGLAPFAHASDGGGSIRVPASSCGLVGLKPARGRVPTRFVGWEHAATDGAEARTVRDAAAILDALAVPDRNVMYNAPVQPGGFLAAADRVVDPLRIGLLLDPPTGLPVDPECIEAAQNAARALEVLGHHVETVTPRFYSERAVIGYLTHIMDAAVATIPYVDPDEAEPYLQARRARAAHASSADYVSSVLQIQEETYEVNRQFGVDFDVLLTPTMATLPVPAGELVAEANADPLSIRFRESQMVSFTSWVNLAGLPAISLPLHMSIDGLPVGVQFVAGPWQEALLVSLASALEVAMPWADRRPTGYDQD